MGSPQHPSEPINADRPVQPSGPHVPQPAGRPGTITAAVVLWIISGGYMGLAGLASIVRTPYRVSPGLATLVGLGMILLGVAVVVLAVRLLSGSAGTPIALTVLGGLCAIGCYTLPLVVIAIILQFRPRSREWWRPWWP